MSKLILRMIRFFSLLCLIYFLVSCGQKQPLYMNSDADLVNIQKEVERLAKGYQIDSVHIRSTGRASLMSSIMVMLNGDSTKTVVEYVPDKDIELRSQSSIENEPLHNYKINISSVGSYIERIKQDMPSNFTYKDVNNIRYAADVFGERYYIFVEVDAIGDFEPNDFVSVFYTTNSPVIDTEEVLHGRSGSSDKYYVISYLIKDGELQIIKNSKK